ncbi:MAG: hypothetical protein NTU80_00055 [Verrucomicrobia bacterium]|nr:hypothetical protein [Verrucomicrobiota bacterium]
MNTKAFLPLALILVAASFTGCAHQTTRTGSKTNLLFGLVEIERGAYQPAPVYSLDANSNDLIGNAGKPSGTQTKIAWGLITNNDY